MSLANDEESSVLLDMEDVEDAEASEFAFLIERMEQNTMNIWKEIHH